MKINIKNVNEETRQKLQEECVRNAVWLLKKAKELFESKNYRISLFLALTSYEECIKSELMYALKDKLITVSDFDRIWGNHQLKHCFSSAPVAIYLDENNKPFSKLHMPRKGSPFFNRINDLLQRREKSLYVGFDGARVVTPKAITAKEARREKKMRGSTILA